MKLSKLFLSLLLFVTILTSCSDENNPVIPTSKNIYIGGIGTERIYKETENWLQIDSNLPYFNVPDTLLSKVSLNSNQLQSGVAAIRDYSEVVESVGEVFYTSWKLSLPRENYLQIEGNGKYYSLADELDSLMIDKTYSAGNYRIGGDIFRISNDGIQTVSPSEMEAMNPHCTYIKNNLQLGDSWVNWKQIDITTNNIIMERRSEVIGKENIVVMAGSFNAYKIKLSSYFYNTSYSSDLGYEYYVPNIGLVLKESDMIVSQWNSGTNITISFRQTIRKELVSYNFIQ